MFFKQENWLSERVWLEEVFRSRNKKYGAYELRSIGSGKAALALFISIIFFLVMLLSGMIRLWYDQIYENVAMDQLVVHEVTLNEPPAGNQGSLPTLLKKTPKPTPEQQSKPSEKIPLKPRITEEENIQPKDKNSSSPSNATQNQPDSGANQGSTEGSSSSSGDSGSGNAVYRRVSRMPVFAGCDELGGSPKKKKKCSEQRLLGFLKSNLRYPSQAIKNKTEGIVVVQFIVEKDGSVSNIQILKDIGDGCGAETIRVLELINTMKLYWTPGMQGSSGVRVQYTLPVEFQGS